MNNADRTMHVAMRRAILERDFRSMKRTFESTIAGLTSEQDKNKLKLFLSGSQSPLIFAIKMKCNDALTLFLELVSNVRRDHSCIYEAMFYQTLDTALRHENLQAVEILLNAGGNLERRGIKMFDIVAEKCNCSKSQSESHKDFLVKATQLLIDAAARSQQDIGVRMALVNTCRARYPNAKLIKTLLRNGASLDSGKLRDVYVGRSKGFFMSDIEELVRNAEDEQDAVECLAAVVDELGDADVQINIQFGVADTKYEPTIFKTGVIYAAVKHAKPEIVKLLVDRGASLKPPIYEVYCEDVRRENAVPPSLLTVLMESCVTNTQSAHPCADDDGYVLSVERVLTLLLDNGVDINERLRGVIFNGATVLTYCFKPESSCFRENMIQFLIDHGADVNREFDSNHCVLKAAFSCSGSLVFTKLQLLLHNGFDPNHYHCMSKIPDALRIALTQNTCASIVNHYRDIGQSDPYANKLEDPLDVSKGCFTCRNLKLFICYGLNESYAAVEDLVDYMLKFCGQSNKPARLRRIALCCLAKVNALYHAGLIRHAAYVRAINFYLRRHNLEDYVPKRPCSLFHQTRRFVVKQMRRRDEESFKSLELPAHMMPGMSFGLDSSLKHSAFEEQSLEAFLTSFSSKERDVPYSHSSHHFNEILDEESSSSSDEEDEDLMFFPLLNASDVDDDDEYPM